MAGHSHRRGSLIGGCVSDSSDEDDDDSPRGPRARGAGMLVGLRRSTNHQRKTKKSQEQVNILLRYFERDRKPTSLERHQISKETNLTVEEVSNWFRNQRARRPKLGHPHDTAPRPQPPPPPPPPHSFHRPPASSMSSFHPQQIHYIRQCSYSVTPGAGGSSGFGNSTPSLMSSTAAPQVPPILPCKRPDCFPSGAGTGLGSLTTGSQSTVPMVSGPPRVPPSFANGQMDSPFNIMGENFHRGPQADIKMDVMSQDTPWPLITPRDVMNKASATFPNGPPLTGARMDQFPSFQTGISSTSGGSQPSMMSLDPNRPVQKATTPPGAAPPPQVTSASGPGMGFQYQPPCPGDPDHSVRRTPKPADIFMAVFMRSRLERKPMLTRLMEVLTADEQEMIAQSLHNGSSMTDPYRPLHEKVAEAWKEMTRVFSADSAGGYLMQDRQLRRQSFHKKMSVSSIDSGHPHSDEDSETSSIKRHLVRMHLPESPSMASSGNDDIRCTPNSTGGSSSSCGSSVDGLHPPLGLHFYPPPLRLPGGQDVDSDVLHGLLAMLEAQRQYIAPLMAELNAMQAEGTFGNSGPGDGHQMPGHNPTTPLSHPPPTPMWDMSGQDPSGGSGGGGGGSGGGSSQPSGRGHQLPHPSTGMSRIHGIPRTAIDASRELELLPPMPDKQFQDLLETLIAEGDN